MKEDIFRLISIGLRDPELLGFAESVAEFVVTLCGNFYGSTKDDDGGQALSEREVIGRYDALGEERAIPANLILYRAALLEFTDNGIPIPIFSAMGRILYLIEEREKDGETIRAS